MTYPYEIGMHSLVNLEYDRYHIMFKNLECAKRRATELLKTGKYDRVGISEWYTEGNAHGIRSVCIRRIDENGNLQKWEY